MSVTLIADSGATKAEWVLIVTEKRTIFTQGISPYFLDTVQIGQLVDQELKQMIKNIEVEQMYYYGTGCSNPENAKSINKALQMLFKEAEVEVNTDLMAAARAVCGNQKGIAVILGTGSNCCYYNGKKIVKK